VGFGGYVVNGIDDDGPLRWVFLGADECVAVDEQ